MLGYDSVTLKVSQIMGESGLKRLHVVRKDGQQLRLFPTRVNPHDRHFSSSEWAMITIPEERCPTFSLARLHVELRILHAPSVFELAL
jgi:hypothetical protein